MRFEDVPWEAAACKGINTDLFYIDTAEALGVNPQLRRVCRGCPILEECREYALIHEGEGFWGGLAPYERRALRTRRRRKGNTTVRRVA